MDAGNHSSSDDAHKNLQRIFLHARNKNLLWRHEILTHNNLDSMDCIVSMEDDIFWDLSEIDKEIESTKSLRMTNLNLISIPNTMSTPITTQILDLSSNNLEYIPSSFFTWIKDVRILRLANNNLTHLEWEGLSQLKFLKVLDLRNNPWDQVFLEKFSGYRRMFLYDIQHIFI